LQAAQECRRIDAYLWHKPKAVCRFWKCADSDLAVFRLWWPHLSTDQHQIPCTDQIRQCRLCIRRWI